MSSAIINSLTLKAVIDGTEIIEISELGTGSFKTPLSAIVVNYQLLSEKGAINGYAGLDASQELLLTNFPGGSALQVLRRNAANTALEFVTPAASGITSINSDTTAAQILAGTANRISLNDAGDTHTFDIASTYVGQASITTLGTITTGVWNGTDITFSNIQDITTARILGRVTAATGIIEELTGTQTTTLLDVFTSTLQGVVPDSGGGTTNFLRADGTWAAPPSGGASSLNDLSDVTITAAAANQILIYNAGATAMENKTMSGDATLAASGALAIVNDAITTVKIIDDAVTYAKIQNVVANNVFLGNNTAPGGIVDELSGTEATVLLDVFTSTLKGLAPLSGGGTTNFLRADGTWVAPPGGGSGLTDLNGLTTDPQFFAVGQADELTISSVTATHTFSIGSNIPRLDETQTWTAKQTFTPDATNPMLNVGAIASNPIIITEGDIWLNTTTDEYIIQRSSGIANILASGTTSTSDLSDGSDIVFLTGTQTISGSKIFSSGALLLRNPAQTANYTIQAGAITADRILNLPVITGTDTLATLGLSQTFTGQISAINATFPPLQGVRTSAITNLIGSSTATKHLTSSNMVDGFGVGHVFQLEDDASGELNIGRISYVRDGADTQSKFVLGINSALTSVFEINTLGNFDFKSGFFDMAEQSTPGNPAANVGRLYVADLTGTTTLFFRDNAGTETNLLTAGGSGDMILAAVQTVTGAKTFVDNALLVQNPAETFEYTLQGGVITADRILNLPVITATDTLTTIGLANAWGTVNQNIAATGKWQEAGVSISPIGDHDQYISAGFFNEVTAAAIATRSISTGDNRKAIAFYSFLNGANEFITGKWIPPENYDGGTITVVVDWTSGVEGSGDVLWAISAVFVSNGDDLTAAATNYGTEIILTADTQTTIDFEEHTARSGAITPANTYSAGDALYIRIQRRGADGGDTFTQPAQFMGLNTRITTDAAVAA